MVVGNAIRNMAAQTAAGEGVVETSAATIYSVSGLDMCDICALAIDKLSKL